MAEKIYTIGLDLGGTNSEFGIVDAQGNIVEHTKVPTPAFPDAETYVDACVKVLMEIIEKAGGLETIKYMGIGAPNGNIITGSIDYAPNIAWAHNGCVPLAKMFSDRLGGLPVTLTNDANAAAIGEMTFGIAKGMKHFIILTLGTGVGSGIVIDGKLVYGHDGFAGELGHVNIKQGGRLCGCGSHGCLETYCSATGLAKTTKEWLHESDEPSLLRDIPEEDINSWEVEKCARKGDAMANRIYDYTGRLLGRACADFMAFSSPEAFIFFGGMAKAGELLLKPIREAFDQNLCSTFKRTKPQFLQSTLNGAGAAILGAASLAPMK